MSEATHTPGPYWNDGAGIFLGNGSEVWRMNSPTYLIEWQSGMENYSEEQAAIDAERVVACVNACEGIANPEELRQQRDDLLAACEGLTERGCRLVKNDGREYYAVPHEEAIAQAREAIAKAKTAP